MTARKNLLISNEESINLLTTLMLYYPELSTINYSPRRKLFKLSFIISKELNTRLIKNFSLELSTALNTYFLLSGKKKPIEFKLKHTCAHGITIIEVIRDASSLSQKEISLIVGYLRNRFGQDIVCEEMYIPEHDLIENDQFITSLLEDLRRKDPKNFLIAVREEGRVLIFQR